MGRPTVHFGSAKGLAHSKCSDGTWKREVAVIRVLRAPIKGSSTCVQLETLDGQAKQRCTMSRALVPSQLGACSAGFISPGKEAVENGCRARRGWPDPMVSSPDRAVPLAAQILGLPQEHPGNKGRCEPRALYSSIFMETLYEVNKV